MASAGLLERCGIVIAAAEALMAAADLFFRAAQCAGQAPAARCEGVVTPGLVHADAIVPSPARREIVLGAEG